MGQTITENVAMIVEALRWGDPRIKRDVWTRIRIEPDTGCWTWTGNARTNGGYGKYCGTGAHLTVWRKLVGPTPVGLQADHVCHDPAACRGGKQCPHKLCVNPAHLAWVTSRVNLSIQRRNRWGYLPDEVPSVDVCKYGHEFTPENTRRNLSRGEWVRRCKACARETARRWQLRKRGEDPGPFAPRLDSEPRKSRHRRTHCRREHEYMPENTYDRPDGRGRECMTCSGR